VGVVTSQELPKIFRALIYGAHCEVVFAIAQLSCFISIYIDTACRIKSKIPRSPSWDVYWSGPSMGLVRLGVEGHGLGP